MDTWIHSIRVFDPHIQLFQGYCFEVAGYSAITSTLVMSERATGPSAHLLNFFFPVYQAGLSRLPVARHRTLILVKLFGIHSLLLSSIYNCELAYLCGTCTPATGSPNERLSSEVIFLLRKESVLRCFGAHSCCQQTYLYRQNPVKSLAYRIDLLIFNVFSQCLSSGSLSNNDVDAYENVT